MNREIKFRAWDGTSMRGIDKNDWFSIRSDGFLSISIPSDFEPVLMQYTGLKDKNSTEIYEGDIIKWRSEYNPEHGEHTDSVVFETGFWNLTPWIFELYATVDREVIGNIYQHPELLEES